MNIIINNFPIWLQHSFGPLNQNPHSGVGENLLGINLNK